MDDTCKPVSKTTPSAAAAAAAAKWLRLLVNLLGPFKLALSIMLFGLCSLDFR